MPFMVLSQICGRWTIPKVIFKWIVTITQFDNLFFYSTWLSWYKQIYHLSYQLFSKERDDPGEWKINIELFAFKQNILWNKLRRSTSPHDTLQNLKSCSLQDNDKQNRSSFILSALSCTVNKVQTQKMISSKRDRFHISISLFLTYYNREILFFMCSFFLFNHSSLSINYSTCVIETLLRSKRIISHF